MGYALFAQRKLVLDGLINSIQMQQNQRADEQLKLSTETLSLQAEVTTMQASQSGELAKLYDSLASADDSDDRASINSQINGKQNEFNQELATIQNRITQTSIKENAIEMEVKRLDTKLTALQKQLEKVEEAEGNGIEKATPQLNGIG